MPQNGPASAAAPAFVVPPKPAFAVGLSDPASAFNASATMTRHESKLKLGAGSKTGGNKASPARKPMSTAVVLPGSVPPSQALPSQPAIPTRGALYLKIQALSDYGIVLASLYKKIISYAQAVDGVCEKQILKPSPVKDTAKSADQKQVAITTPTPTTGSLTLQANLLEIRDLFMSKKSLEDLESRQDFLTQVNALLVEIKVLQDNLLNLKANHADFDKVKQDLNLKLGKLNELIAFLEEWFVKNSRAIANLLILFPENKELLLAINELQDQLKRSRIFYPLKDATLSSFDDKFKTIFKEVRSEPEYKAHYSKFKELTKKRTGLEVKIIANFENGKEFVDQALEERVAQSLKETLVKKLIEEKTQLDTEIIVRYESEEKEGTGFEMAGLAAVKVSIIQIIVLTLINNRVQIDLDAAIIFREKISEFFDRQKIKDFKDDAAGIARDDQTIKDGVASKIKKLNKDLFGDDEKFNLCTCKYEKQEVPEGILKDVKDYIEAAVAWETFKKDAEASAWLPLDYLTQHLELLLEKKYDVDVINNFLKYIELIAKHFPKGKSQKFIDTWLAFDEKAPVFLPMFDMGVFAGKELTADECRERLVGKYDSEMIEVLLQRIAERDLELKFLQSKSSDEKQETLQIPQLPQHIIEAGAIRLFCGELVDVRADAIWRILIASAVSEQTTDQLLLLVRIFPVIAALDNDLDLIGRLPLVDRMSTKTFVKPKDAKQSDAKTVGQSASVPLQSVQDQDAKKQEKTKEEKENKLKALAARYGKDPQIFLAYLQQILANIIEISILPARVNDILPLKDAKGNPIKYGANSINIAATLVEEFYKHYQQGHLNQAFEVCFPEATRLCGQNIKGRLSPESCLAVEKLIQEYRLQRKRHAVEDVKNALERLIGIRREEIRVLVARGETLDGLPVLGKLEGLLTLTDILTKFLENETLLKDTAQIINTLQGMASDLAQVNTILNNENYANCVKELNNIILPEQSEVVIKKPATSKDEAKLMAVFPIPFKFRRPIEGVESTAVLAADVSSDKVAKDSPHTSPVGAAVVSASTANPANSVPTMRSSMPGAQQLRAIGGTIAHGLGDPKLDTKHGPSSSLPQSGLARTGSGNNIRRDSPLLGAATFSSATVFTRLPGASGGGESAPTLSTIVLSGGSDGSHPSPVLGGTVLSATLSPPPQDGRTISTVTGSAAGSVQSTPSSNSAPVILGSPQPTAFPAHLELPVAGAAAVANGRAADYRVNDANPPQVPSMNRFL